MKNSDAYEKALKQVKRHDDGSFDEKDLVDELAALIDFDPDEERHKAAKREVDRRRKPGSTEADGQLSFPGLSSYDYEPLRLVGNDEGQAVEQDRSLPAFKAAEARRSRKHAQEATAWADRKQTEESRFALWFAEQLMAGRKAGDLTFGVFLRETGIWGPREEDSA